MMRSLISHLLHSSKPHRLHFRRWCCIWLRRKLLRLLLLLLLLRLLLRIRMHLRLLGMVMVMMELLLRLLLLLHILLHLQLLLFSWDIWIKIKIIDKCPSAHVIISRHSKRSHRHHKIRSTLILAFHNWLYKCWRWL